MRLWHKPRNKLAEAERQAWAKVVVTSRRVELALDGHIGRPGVVEACDAFDAAQMAWLAAHDKLVAARGDT
jgi:hypothetical protein